MIGRYKIPAALCAALFAMAGCSLFHPIPKEAPPVAKALPPPKPQLPTPNATHKFEVVPDSDIVGYVQLLPVGDPPSPTAPHIACRRRHACAGPDRHLGAGAMDRALSL